MRIGSFLCTLAVAGLLAADAGAALKKYRLQRQTGVNTSDVTPSPDTVARGNSDFGKESEAVALVEDSGSNAILRRLVDATDRSVTVLVPSLATNIFVSNNLRQGPGTGVFNGGPVPSFTGTGSTASTIRWGTVTGWTQSGSFWCNSNPGVICSLAMGMDEDTVDPRANSEFYDLGTWFFHGTGFTSIPYINSYNTNNFGNTTHLQKGFLKRDGTVPALPVLGVVLLGSSLVAGGVAAMRRNRS